MAGSASQLNLASNAIALTKSFIDFVPASGTLLKLGQETYNWVIREGLDEGLFESCRELALDLAYPNSAGLEIQEKIEQGNRKLHQKKAPLRLIWSGALGRLLAGDMRTCYIVSTVAVITKYHSSDFAADLLCSMLLNREGHQSGLVKRYDIERAPIRAVVSRIVDSVYLNVVNTGHDLGDLPAKLKDLPSFVLEHRTFAAIVMRVQHENHDIVIKSRRLPADLTLWLLRHFHGMIEVSVGNRILYTEELGSTGRLIKLMVRKPASEDEEEFPSLNRAKECPVEVQISIGDRLDTVLTGNHDANAIPVSRTRRSLYETDVCTSTRRPGYSLKQEEYLRIQHLAKRLMEWILRLTIQPAASIVSPNSDCDLVFRVVNTETLDDKYLRLRCLGDMFPRHPRLLHIETGFPSDTTGLAIKEPSDRGDSKSQAYKDLKATTDELGPYAVLEWIPAVIDTLNLFRIVCTCRACASSSALRACKMGCRRILAVDLLYTLLAHAICDAFGIDDVSGKDASSVSTAATGAVLKDIIYHREIHWNSWFELVACTASGLRFEDIPRQHDEGSSAWVALQYGSYILTAPWLDIEKPINVKGCFALNVFEGNIEGAPSDVVALRCEVASLDWAGSPATRHTEHQEGDNTHTQQPDSDERLSCLDAACTLDTSLAKLSTTIFKSGPNLFRVMITVQAGNRFSVVDPSQTIMGLARSPEQPECAHLASASPTWDGLLYCADFAMLLEQSFCRDHYSSHSCLTTVVDSHLKLNTIFSIARYGAVLRCAERCCLQCALGRIVSSDGQSRYPVPVSLVINTVLGQDSNVLSIRS